MIKAVEISGHEADSRAFIHRVTKYSVNCLTCVIEVGVRLPVLQVLYRSQTLEPAVDHDGHSGAKSLTFLHTDHTDT